MAGGRERREVEKKRKRNGREVGKGWERRKEEGEWEEGEWEEDIHVSVRG